MKLTGVTGLSALAALVMPTSGAKSCASGKTLVVDAAPDHVRPYVLPRFQGKAVLLTQSQTITFSITANSSGGAFSIVQHNGKVTEWLNARPHYHNNVHEHVYCARGRVELWARRDAKRNHTGPTTEEARVASFGDYANIPPGTLHTFQLIDPDSQLTHIFHPAGFEKLFADPGINSGAFASPAQAPYLTHGVDEEPFGPMTPELHALLEPLDLYAVERSEYDPRRDFVNGTAGDAGLNWHNGTNELPTDNKTPYYVASNYGPKFLNTDAGYKVIQPISTVKNSHNGNFTMGTIIMSKRRAGDAASTANLPHHFAIQVDDGRLVLAVEGYKTTALMQGDVAFIPAGTPFKYHATVPHTKFLYLNAGPNGIEHELLKTSMPWQDASYPVEHGFKAKPAQ